MPRTLTEAIFKTKEFVVSSFISEAFMAAAYFFQSQNSDGSVENVSTGTFSKHGLSFEWQNLAQIYTKILDFDSIFKRLNSKAK